MTRSEPDHEIQHQRSPEEPCISHGDKRQEEKDEGDILQPCILLPDIDDHAPEQRCHDDRDQGDGCEKLVMVPEIPGLPFHGGGEEIPHAAMAAIMPAISM